MNFSKFISLKLLSVFGYIYFIFYIIDKFVHIFLFEQILCMGIYISVLLFIIELFLKAPFNIKKLISNFKNQKLKDKLFYIFKYFGLIPCFFVLKWVSIAVFLIILIRPIINYKNLINNKLLSISGYFAFIFIIIFHLKWLPEAYKHSIANTNFDIIVMSNILLFYKIIIIYYILCSLICLLAIFEYQVRKKSSNLSCNFKTTKNIYNFIYYFGLFLIFSPIMYLLIRYIT